MSVEQATIGYTIEWKLEKIDEATGQVVETLSGTEVVRFDERNENGTDQRVS